MRFLLSPHRVSSLFPSFRASVAVAALGLVSACSYLIPENSNEPRYNSLIGERRIPELNREMRGQMPPQPGYAAPVPQVAVSDMPPAEVASPFPPVDEATRAQAEMRMAQAAPVPMPQDPAGYPALSHVPPRPVTAGSDAATARLEEVRRQLERDRIAAGGAASQLQQAAAAEGSMLSELPRETAGVVPPLEPVNVAPVPPPPAAAVPDARSPQMNPAPLAPVQASGAVPSPRPPASSGYIALPPPPPPLYVPPPPASAQQAVAPAAAPATAPAVTPTVGFRQSPEPVAAQTTRAPAATTMEPIRLRAPSAAAVAAPAPALAPAPRPAFSQTPRPLPPAASGGFDPMAGANYRPKFFCSGGGGVFTPVALFWPSMKLLDSAYASL